MQYFYDTNIIPKILKMFKVKNAVISGIKDDNIINNILNYNATFTEINTNDSNSIKDDPLNALSDLENYDAIFINDDSNWYTVFNELEIIKKTNDEFPLVFICNNTFPNKRRDSYSNPDNIPLKFRHKYTTELPIHYNNEKIIITDGKYHACEENTPKNGVLTAIEDFLADNHHIGMMKINFIENISILYLKSQINQKRVSVITNIPNDKLDDINISDKLIENQLLITYINKNNIYNKDLNEFEVEISRKDTIINNYENKIRAQNNELKFKDTQLNGSEITLNLKDSQIKNIESKLVNRDRKIINLETQLKTTNNDLHTLNQEINEKDEKINELTNNFKQKESNYNIQINSLNQQLDQKNQDLTSNKNQYIKEIQIKDKQINSLKNDLTKNKNNFTTIESKLNHEINSHMKDIQQKDHQIEIQQKELDDNKLRINTLEHSYGQQLSRIDNDKYCIRCFKDEISNNHLEINYLKNNNITKTILSPLAYIYLIFKSNPKDISINIKLYRALKDSGCFDIGFYLNNNKDLIKSKWCKYFSPELHYICNGFSENRSFNKKYFNRNSKKDLLNYILTCKK